MLIYFDLKISRPIKFIIRQIKVLLRMKKKINVSTHQHRTFLFLGEKRLPKQEYEPREVKKKSKILTFFVNTVDRNH